MLLSKQMQRMALAKIYRMFKIIALAHDLLK